MNLRARLLPPVRRSACSACGRLLAERRRRPCPTCGGLTRSITATANESLGTADRAS